ncbi:hypothetical protein H0264_31295 [Nocardia huaxiensis]|uniref:Uncharacterized protein n=1 Tax=Nocardia huaxiensis TaxID=2755382 RepID=A0A7D6ZFI0_9NOCA|nr:hypothetical protein [Nocardia huaxiensis]QLY29679.1 hypothetical protein H0264_31295 [Nocardia huaxiensis]
MSDSVFEIDPARTAQPGSRVDRGKGLRAIGLWLGAGLVAVLTVAAVGGVLVTVIGARHFTSLGSGGSMLDPMAMNLLSLLVTAPRRLLLVAPLAVGVGFAVAAGGSLSVVPASSIRERRLSLLMPIAVVLGAAVGALYWWIAMMVTEWTALSAARRSDDFSENAYRHYAAQLVDPSNVTWSLVFSVLIAAAVGAALVLARRIRPAATRPARIRRAVVCAVVPLALSGAVLALHADSVYHDLLRDLGAEALE